MAFKLKLELLLFAILEGCCLVLLAVGTAMPVMQSYDNSVQFTMWEKRLIYNSATTRMALSDLKDCDFTKEKLQVMAAFAILSIAFCLFGIVFTVLDVLHRPTHKWATEVFGAIVWFCTLIVWAVGLAVFRLPMCGGSGFVPTDSLWKFGPCFIIFVSIWALLMLSMPVMFIIKLYVRPTYWQEAEAAEGEDAPPVPPADALRRKKSKRSFVADSSDQKYSSS